MLDRQGSPDTALPGRPAVVVARVDIEGGITMAGREELPDLFDIGEADRLLTAKQVAQVLGISLGTWSAYVSRGQAPEADDKELDRPEGLRQHKWRVSTVAKWKATRRRTNPRKRAEANDEQG